MWNIRIISTINSVTPEVMPLTWSLPQNFSSKNAISRDWPTCQPWWIRFAAGSRVNFPPSASTYGNFSFHNILLLISLSMHWTCRSFSASSWSPTFACRWSEPPRFINKNPKSAKHGANQSVWLLGHCCGLSLGVYIFYIRHILHQSYCVWYVWVWSGATRRCSSSSQTTCPLCWYG
jgi:hypothetical protein